MEYKCKNIKIKVLKWGSILIEGSITLVIDPSPKDSTILTKSCPSLILVSHHHLDRLSSKPLLQLKECAEKILIGGSKRIHKDFAPDQICPLEFWQMHISPSVRVQALPAYNSCKYKREGVLYHPITAGGLGYLILLDNVKIYYAGHTDKIPEMAKVENLDVLICPISSKSYLDPGEAASVVKALEPSITVPVYPLNIKVSAKLKRSFVAACDKISL